MLLSWVPRHHQTSVLPIWSCFITDCTLNMQCFTGTSWYCQILFSSLKKQYCQILLHLLNWSPSIQKKKSFLEWIRTSEDGFFWRREYVLPNMSSNMTASYSFSERNVWLSAVLLFHGSSNLAVNGKRVVKHGADSSRVVGRSASVPLLLLLLLLLAHHQDSRGAWPGRLLCSMFVDWSVGTTQPS